MAEPRYQLVACDIYRDGGSLGVIVSQSNSFVSLFLEIGPWDLPSDRKDYRSLRGFDSEIAEAHCVELDKSSAIEKQWLVRCQNIRHSNDLDARSIELFAIFADVLVRRNR